VNLKTPVPVLLLYVTAVAEEDGSVHFFDDIYGHDRKLNAVLAKGPPYP
jgi:murein L,D-transpeptidase YcbB/YkuD